MPYKDSANRRMAEKIRRLLHPEKHRKYDATYKRTNKGRFASLKAKAKIRKIRVTLKLNEFILLRNKPCYYCGGALPDVGHGLDRLINSIGYEKGNVISCCGPCNRIRGSDLTHEEMVAAMCAVLGHRKVNDV